MEAWFLYAGMALCLFSLAMLARRDLARFGTIRREASAEVVSHRITRDNDGTSYAAVMRFMAEGQSHEAIDEVLHTVPTPPLGTRVTLVFPEGRHDLARVPRPLMWLVVYVLLIGLFGLLLAKLLGWLPHTGGG